ncbi:class I glutamine amidotransferase-like protein [Collybia nuda]|uniref:Class I glutamine amidotransferase-like protein n=1 Tax=Collybia nuda TaxID=64659 RepID=A0A9P5YBL8_9AGAR|nr:class I glutamine amidotransferase-like protein [Collybia nuda]
MSTSTKSLALLICGSLTANLIEKYGDYSQVFGTFFRNSLPENTDFTLDAYDVFNKMEYPSEEKLGQYDGIVLTGSAASAYENVEWINKLVAFIARIANDLPQIKIIGICFGHQIVGRALGGECVPNNGIWEVGPTTVDLTDLGKEFFGVETLNVQQMHRDHVPTVPTTFHLLGSTSACFNQGMVRFSPGTTPGKKDLKDVQVFAIQGHPEFDKGIVSGLVEARLSTGIFDEGMAADVKRREDWRNDGIPILGRAIWAVLGVTV